MTGPLATRGHKTRQLDNGYFEQDAWEHMAGQSAVKSFMENLRLPERSALARPGCEGVTAWSFRWQPCLVPCTLLPLGWGAEQIPKKLAVKPEQMAGQLFVFKPNG